MISLLENCDFLSKQEYLRINSKKRYQNITGGILSLSIILLSVIMIFYFIIDMLYNNDPRVYESKIINQSSKDYNLDKNNIEFFVSLEHRNSTYYLDETVYKVSAVLSEMRFEQVNGTVKQYSSEQEVKMIPCSNIYNSKEIQKFNVNFPQKLFYCFPPGKSYFGGFWGSTHYTSTKIYIKKCSNNTLDKDDFPCKPIDYIDSVIDYGIISIMISDYLVNHKNFTDPLTKYLMNNFDRLSYKNAINYLISYSSLIYSTDVGLIFNSLESTEYPIIGDFKTSYNFGESNTIAFIQIECNYFQVNYLRSYVKLQDLLTKIGGVVKSLVLFGNFFNYFYSYAFSTIDNVLSNHVNLSIVNELNLNAPDKKFFFSNSFNNNFNKVVKNLKDINHSEIKIKNNNQFNNKYLNCYRKGILISSRIKEDKMNKLENERFRNVHNQHLNIINETSNANLNFNNRIEQINISSNINLNNHQTISRKMFEIEKFKQNKNIKHDISKDY